MNLRAFLDRSASRSRSSKCFPRFAPQVDADIAKALRGELAKKNVTFHTGAKVLEITADTVRFEKNGKPESVPRDVVLLSTGRVCNVNNLGLEEARIEFDRRGIKVDDRCATNQPGVFAIGDCTGRAWLAHTATRMGEVVVNNLTGRRDAMRWNAIPGVVYTNPEVAVVGLTEAEAKTKGIPVKCAKLPMAVSGRYLAEHDGERGQVKVVIHARRSRQLLGVHLMGGACSEMIWGAAAMIESEFRATEIEDIVFPTQPHPRSSAKELFLCTRTNSKPKTTFRNTMPKQIIIDPAKERKGGTLTAPVIPLCQYNTPLAAEIKRFGRDAVVGMYEDMLLIREFESMLHAIKTEGSYQGVTYDHKGPAHLSIGQEAAAVGQSFHLGIDDHIYGSHRSHGEILAKGLSAIRKLDDASLQSIMTGYLGGECLKIVERHFQGGSVRDLAIHYLVYGALAEIFGREPGFNRGLGGSMHAFFPPFGILPNNARAPESAVRAISLPARRCSEKSQPSQRHRDRQCRRCVDGLRACVGRHEFRLDGPISQLVGQGAPRWFACDLQHHE